MPHLRKRHIESHLRKLLTFSPLVGILGHRQVGKTTLAGLVGHDYYSLDLRSTQDMVENDPLGFLMSIRKFPAVLDECQTVPELFPALKEYVRIHPKPGAFILTGSVRFTSRKAIRESLTGRVIYQDLLPMDVSEISGLPFSDLLPNLSKDLNFVAKLRNSSRSERRIPEYLEKGGLPGIFSIRDTTVRRQKIATQLETILDRDLRLLTNVRLPFSSLRNVLGYLARHQGEAIRLSDMVRSTRVTRPTLLKLLQAFESLFLTRFVPTEGLRASKVYYLEDQAEASYLIGPRTEPLFDLTRFLYANLRPQALYRQAELFRYETRGGAHVPLCFRIGKRELGVLPVLEQNPNRSSMASAVSFLKAHPQSSLVFVTENGTPTRLSPRLATIPASAF